MEEQNHSKELESVFEKKKKEKAPKSKARNKLAKKVKLAEE